MDKALKTTFTSISDKAKYDECAKQLLAQKHILAHILIKTVDAFKGMNANDVVQYIEGEPYISTVPVEQYKPVSKRRHENSWVKY